MADKLGMNEYRNQFAFNTQDEEMSTMKAPERMEKKFKRMDRERR